MEHSTLLKVLARAFLAGEQTVEQVVARTSHTLGRNWRWLRPLARRYIQKFSSQTAPRERDVAQFLLLDQGRRNLDKLTIRHWMNAEPEMHPVPAAESWALPALETSSALADWLGLSAAELDWFADLKGLVNKNHRPKLRHYNYKVFVKHSGSVRLIEAPKLRMKELQRQILAGILENVPPHPAAHGFVQGRSIKTFATPHVGQRVVLRMDLRDFFPNIPTARIQTIFRTMGYPDRVADLLGGICTNAAPKDIWKPIVRDFMPVDSREAKVLYSRSHLPQGAPTSPTLANICAYRLDCRLTGLAGAAEAQYTRYADDLAFSGGAFFEQRVERFATHVAAILLEEGFSVHYRKTRIMRQGVRQHLAGLVTNERVNIMRPDFDRLKATLTNCVRFGPASQNRDAHPHFRSHLDGRIGFVEMINPSKGYRLRAIFDQIDWPGS